MKNFIFEHFNRDGFITPKRAFEIYGDFPISVYVDALAQFSVIEDGEKLTHREICLKHISRYGDISQMEATHVYEMLRLSAVIKNIRKLFKKENKWEIVSTDLPTSRGGKYSRYSIVAINHQLDEKKQ